LSIFGVASAVGLIITVNSESVIFVYWLVGGWENGC